MSLDKCKHGIEWSVMCRDCDDDDDEKQAEHGSVPIPGRTNSGYLSGSLEFNPIELNTITEQRCHGIEKWIIDAAKDLAMDSAHVPLIAAIIQRHAPPPKGRGQ